MTTIRGSPIVPARSAVNGGMTQPIIYVSSAGSPFCLLTRDTHVPFLTLLISPALLRSQGLKAQAAVEAVVFRTTLAVDDAYGVNHGDPQSGARS